MAQRSSALVRSADKISVDLELTSDQSRNAVRITGEIWCPPLALTNEIPPSMVEWVRRHSGANVRRYSTYDFGRAQDPSSISTVVPESLAQAVLSRLRSELPPGFVAFIGTTQWLGEEKHEGVEVVVGPGRDQFDILRLARSDAVNYDMTTECLVKKLREYHRRDPIDIFQAETDTIQFRLLEAPKNPGALANDIYAFCPDVVDQGVGTLEALEMAVTRERRVFLWWD